MFLKYQQNIFFYCHQGHCKYLSAEDGHSEPNELLTECHYKAIRQSTSEIILSTGIHQPIREESFYLL